MASLIKSCMTGVGADGGGVSESDEPSESDSLMLLLLSLSGALATEGLAAGVTAGVTVGDGITMVVLLLLFVVEDDGCWG